MKNSLPSFLHISNLYETTEKLGIKIYNDLGLLKKSVTNISCFKVLSSGN
jgi:hypothetical protein